jgi:hypothetical protein
MTRSPWVEKSPSPSPHKGLWSIDTAGIAPSTLLQPRKGIEKLDSLSGHELDLGGPPLA